MLASRLPEARLGEVDDPRDARGQRWPLTALLTAVVTGLAVGCKSLAQTEALTAEMSPAVRRRLGIRRRVSDTTLRDALVKVEPKKLRRSLLAQTKAAHRRKALEPDGLPFGMAAMDGKGSTATAWDRKYAQKQTHSAGLGAVGGNDPRKARRNDRGQRDRWCSFAPRKESPKSGACARRDGGWPPRIRASGWPTAPIS
ncbi:MAG: transposase family protein [Myxococcales bacterium]|nr:transposase family protein [Myxococcales bacterium]